MNKTKLPYEVLGINTADMIVPRYSYQRDLDPPRVQAIVKHFDERIANRPKVSCRDGSYYVVDGQHTIEARKILNGNKDLVIACRVFYGLTEEEEALLFAMQFGFSDMLKSGVKLRALIYGKDPQAVAFLQATNSVGIDIDFDHLLGKDRIGCVSCAYNAFLRVGKDVYTEALGILKAAWDGEPHSLRGENVRALIEFVNLYQGEYDPERLIMKLKEVDPLTIFRKGEDMGNEMTGHKRYLYQVYTIYNGNDPEYALPLKF